MRVFTLALAVLLFGATSLWRAADSDGIPRADSTTAVAPRTLRHLKTKNTTAAQPSSPSVTAGAVPLRVMVGKSLLINTTERLKRVAVTDPGVADALVVTPTQVLVNGLAPGEVSY